MITAPHNEPEQDQSELAGVKISNGNDTKPQPHDVRLKDGEPLFYALLQTPKTPHLSAYESNEARGRLYDLIKINPDAVLGCQGKTAEQALAILESIDKAN